jgi:hypothetical protein
MQLEPTSAVSRRQQILFSDVHAVTLCIHIEYWRAEAEGREPQVSAVLDRFLDFNAGRLNRATARLLVAIVLYRSSLVDEKTRAALLEIDAELRQWLAENPE